MPGIIHRYISAIRLKYDGDLYIYIFRKTRIIRKFTGLHLRKYTDHGAV